MKVTKAASPFSLAASKAASILPPTPRSISATETVSAEATPRVVVFAKVLERGLATLVAAGLIARVNAVEGENASVEDAMQPNQREKDTRRIILFCTEKLANGEDSGSQCKTD